MFFKLPKRLDQYFSTWDNSLIQGICVPKSNPFIFWYFGLGKKDLFWDKIRKVFLVAKVAALGSAIWLCLSVSHSQSSKFVCVLHQYCKLSFPCTVPMACYVLSVWYSCTFLYKCNVLSVWYSCVHYPFLILLCLSLYIPYHVWCSVSLIFLSVPVHFFTYVMFWKCDIPACPLYIPFYCTQNKFSD